MATATGTEATRLDLVLQPGASLRFQVDVGQLNLGAATAAMEIKSKDRFPVLLLALSDGSGITITEATGIVDVDITPAQTALILENALYDLVLTYADASADKLRTGAVTRRRPTTT